VRWYILKNRRHEGPFTEEQLRTGLKQNFWQGQDFLLPEDKLDEGEFEYKILSEVLKLSINAYENKNITQSAHVEFPEDDEQVQERRKEVTRVFEDTLDVIDLVSRKEESVLENANLAFKESSKFVIEKKSIFERVINFVKLHKWGFTVASVLLFAFIFLIEFQSEVVMNNKNISSNSIENSLSKTKTNNHTIASPQPVRTPSQ
jgi:hypothetical protein